MRVRWWLGNNSWHACTLFTFHNHSSTFKANSEAEWTYEHAAFSVICFKLWWCADIPYLIFLPEPSLKQAWYEGSISKSPSPSFLYIPLPSKQSPVLHERRELRCTNRESSFRVKPVWSHFTFPVRRQDEAHTSPLSLSLSLSLLSSLLSRPSWSCIICSLSRSGVHSYPMWLRHPLTHKQPKN